MLWVVWESLHLSGEHSRRDVQFNGSLPSTRPFAGSVTLGQLLPNHASFSLSYRDAATAEALRDDEKRLSTWHPLM